MTDAVVELADRSGAIELAALHRRAALAAYGHIFPPEAPPPTVDELAAMWEHWLGDDWDRGRRAFVARLTGDTIGVVLTGPDPEDPPVGHLARLYVDPGQWGRGIGRRLYVAAIDQLHRDGFTAATLWTLEANERARSWYERLGWRTTGRRKPVYEPAGIDDVQYRLELRVSGSG
ncbi:MAG: GNAT family N-acetyltransferase [Acidimicrobiales bacterium]